MRSKSALIPLCAVAIAVTSAPAAAYDPQSNSVSTAKPPKKICRWVDRTGTHRIERVCLTSDEWRRVEEYIAKQF